MLFLVGIRTLAGLTSFVLLIAAWPRFLLMLWIRVIVTLLTMLIRLADFAFRIWTAALRIVAHVIGSVAREMQSTE